MSGSWHFFFTRQLPVALIALAVGVEVLSIAMDGIPFRRHDLDLLALNVNIETTDTSPGTIVVGDSVTQGIFKSYAIGAPGDVANLTTNQANGLAGTYLLLRRYLRHHAPPRYLVIAATPEFYTFQPDGETARVYLETVFRQPYEVAFLDAYLKREKAFYEPAIMHMDERLGLKFLAFMASSPGGLLMGDKQPDPDGQPLAHDLQDNVRNDIRRRGENALIIPADNLPILQAICGLAKSYEFNIRILTAPIPETTYDMWTQSDRLTRFQSQRDTFFDAECPQLYSADQDRLLIVPDGAMRDSDHLIRHDWTNVYAVLLDDLVRRLP